MTTWLQYDTNQERVRALKDQVFKNIAHVEVLRNAAQQQQTLAPIMYADELASTYLMDEAEKYWAQGEECVK